MLAIKRKQMAAIGEAHLRHSLADCVSRHFGAQLPLPLDQLDAELDAVIAYCRKAGLRSQRAIAAYAVACVLFGNRRVAQDPSIAAILADRGSPQLDRALMIEMWTAEAYADYRRMQGA